MTNKHLMLFLLLIGQNIAIAKPLNIYTAPIHGVGMDQGRKIIVDYHYNPHTQSLVCFHGGDWQAITTVNWIYNGRKGSRSITEHVLCFTFES